MAEDRARPDEARMIVHVQIALAGGEQLAHPGDLGGVLAQMGLQVDARMIAQKRARGLELRLARGGGEAGGHAIELPALPVPAPDQRGALVIALLRGIEQGRGGVAVHQHFARDHPGVQPRGFRKERLHRLRMHSAIDHGRGGARAQQLAQEHLRHHRGMGRLGELLLGHEGVGIEPFEQLRAIGADHLQLRIMHMGVDHAGHDQLIGVVHRRDARGQQRRGFGIGAGRGDPARLHDHQPVGMMHEALLRVALERIAVEIDDLAAQGCDGHAGLLKKLGLAHSLRENRGEGNPGARYLPGLRVAGGEDPGRGAPSRGKSLRDSPTGCAPECCAGAAATSRCGLS